MVDVGDMRPNESAGSASLGKGRSGVMANPSALGDARGSVGVIWSGSSCGIKAGTVGRLKLTAESLGSTTFTTGTRWPEASTYADVRFTALTVLARRCGTGGASWLLGHFSPDGADDGPGSTGGSDGEGLACCGVSATLADSGIVNADGSEGLLEKGPLQSLVPEPGVSGVRARLLDRTPPHDKLVLNSCSCIMRFMFGPIHLLRALTASYASCTLMLGFLYRP